MRDELFVKIDYFFLMICPLSIVTLCNCEFDWCSVILNYLVLMFTFYLFGISLNAVLVLPETIIANAILWLVLHYKHCMNPTWELPEDI